MAADEGKDRGGSRREGRHEIWVGLEILDEEGYGAYRRAMTPLLEARGGRFRHDFRVAETLTTEADHPIQRVFVLSFPDREAMEAFFGDEAYRAIRREHFEPAVGAATVLGESDG